MPRKIVVMKKATSALRIVAVKANPVYPSFLLHPWGPQCCISTTPKNTTKIQHFSKNTTLKNGVIFELGSKVDKIDIQDILNDYDKTIYQNDPHETGFLNMYSFSM